MDTTKLVKRPVGEAVAALWSAMIGLLALAVTHFGSEASADFRSFVFSAGKAWIPNAAGIGPYSGKETFMLIGWLGSWAVLHLALRRKNLNLTLPMAVFTAGMALATLLVYTPFIHFVLG